MDIRGRGGGGSGELDLPTVIGIANVVLPLVYLSGRLGRRMHLLLISVIHTSHRPILDLLPSLLDSGRQLVHVLKESCKCPHLLVAEGVRERRHARQTNAVLDLPERNAFWVVLHPVSRHLRGLLIKAFRYR